MPADRPFRETPKPDVDGAGQRDVSDRDQADPQRTEKTSGREDSRRTRSQTAIESDLSAQARREQARVREAVAKLRDRAADVRDADASTRDKFAFSVDAEILQRDHRRAVDARERSAQANEAAARDRTAAAADRAGAAQDRVAAQAEMALEGIDDLTGALRRHNGLEALRRELARTLRTHEPLMVAFIDVDGLKAVNDEHGHADGDALLRGVVQCLTRVLRPYDVIIRFGGDEFVCVLCGQNLPGLHERFAQVAAELAQRHNNASITVGLAQAGTEDSPEQLIARADQAMIAARRRRA